MTRAPAQTPTWGASRYDVRKIFELFDPLPSLSAFGTDFYYKIHATYLTTQPSDADIIPGSSLGPHGCTYFIIALEGKISYTLSNMKEVSLWKGSLRRPISLIKHCPVMDRNPCRVLPHHIHPSSLSQSYQFVLTAPPPSLSLLLLIPRPTQHYAISFAIIDQALWHSRVRTSEEHTSC